MFEQLAKIGVQVMDGNGDYRKTKDVLIDLSTAWNNLSKRKRKRFIKNIIKWNLK